MESKNYNTESLGSTERDVQPMPSKHIGSNFLSNAPLSGKL